MGLYRPWRRARLRPPWLNEPHYRAWYDDDDHALPLAPTTQHFAGSRRARGVALHAQFDTERAYRQSEAVRLRYPDPSMRFDTPGFAPGRTDFTSQQEMMQFISALQPRARNMEVRVAGHSQEGRAIPVLVFRGPNAAAAPVVLLVGLQHGN